MSTKSERTQAIDQLEKVFSESDGVYLTDINRINGENMTHLRAELRAQNVSYVVVKNSLARIACGRCGKEALNPYFVNGVGVAFAGDDPTAPAKVIKEFTKDPARKNLLTVRAAMVENNLLNSEDAAKLADIPSREVLLAQLLGCLKTPLGNCAAVLNGILLKLTGTLEAVQRKKQEENS